MNTTVTTRRTPSVSAPAPSSTQAEPTPAAGATEASRARREHGGRVVAGRSDPEVRAFGRAIIIGSLIGFPVLGLVIGLVVRLFAPTTELVAIIGIAVWVGLFCGPFLGGTVTVGLYSNRQH